MSRVDGLKSFIDQVGNIIDSVYKMGVHFCGMFEVIQIWRIVWTVNFFKWLMGWVAWTLVTLGVYVFPWASTIGVPFALPCGNPSADCQSICNIGTELTEEC